MKDVIDVRPALLWIVLLTGASLLLTGLLACMMPFAALAALAAVHLRPRDGFLLMAVAWAAGQAVGFAALGYPHDPSTLAWGAGIGAAALLAAGAAYPALAPLAGAPLVARLAVAFAAAFLGFKLGLTPFALLLGGIEITWSPALLATQVPREAAILVGLLALHRLLVAFGLPAARGRAHAA